ncbi:hypothetical protein HG15A2_04060 [Adhaeretor mobilis]|uniref:Uncharacterized protein n=1 Tax=Adhaeretor mobilis TaxID=1930276 RepID=A0A517MQI9_9BACT|nr:hypothetical protein HG15A2_04060 [Adhaeretor mobilis]
MELPTEIVVTQVTGLSQPVWLRLVLNPRVDQGRLLTRKLQNSFDSLETSMRSVYSSMISFTGCTKWGDFLLKSAAFLSACLRSLYSNNSTRFSDWLNTPQ